MSVKIKTVTGRTQAQGVFVIALDRNHSSIQIDAETSAKAQGGTLKLQFVSPGMSVAKDFLGATGSAVVIDLAKPYPVVFKDLSVDQLIVTPIGFDADKSFSVGIVLGGQL
jgi:hypothetical protein